VSPSGYTSGLVLGPVGYARKFRPFWLLWFRGLRSSCLQLHVDQSSVLHQQSCFAPRPCGPILLVTAPMCSAFQSQLLLHVHNEISPNFMLLATEAAASRRPSCRTPDVQSASHSINVMEYQFLLLQLCSCSYILFVDWS